jgi:iron complex transport system substrate-binding protein
MFLPRRVVCLTEETVETLNLLGEQDRIVGISGYVVRPPQARREKPRVSAFTSANIDKILALKPDLVLTFSDLQAGIAADLIRRGLDVHAFNQRSVAGILDMIRMVGAMVDVSDRVDQPSQTPRKLFSGSPKPRRKIEEAAADALRKVGRSADFRNWMGLGARLDRRRHRHLRRS